MLQGYVTMVRLRGRIAIGWGGGGGLQSYIRRVHCKAEGIESQ